MRNRKPHNLWTNWRHLIVSYDEYINNTLSDASFCPTTYYALQVIKQYIVTSKAVKDACQRHLDDLKKSFNNESEFYFSQKHAQHIFDFAEKFCKHTKGEFAGKPIKLELWQKFIFGSLMGWRKKDTNCRRFNISYVQIARKNGKSTMISVLLLYMFYCDKEPGAEIYTASVKKDTAKIVWLDCMRMIKANKSLKKGVKIQESLSTLWKQNSVIKALSADSGQDGLNIHAYALDEVHLLPNNEMYNVLVSATGARQQPMGFLITTAGESRGGTSFCYSYYEFCKRILNKSVENDSVFVYIAELDSQDEIHDPSNYIKANPNLGVSITLEYLTDAYKRAVDGGEYDNFLIKHMNLWISKRTAYFPMDKWGDKPRPQLEGLPCWVGVDLASRIDLCSVTAVFPHENGSYSILSHSFMPENIVNYKMRMDRVPYKAWIKAGYITATPGDVIDIDYVYSYIKQLQQKYNVVEVDLDPWQAAQLIKDLEADGTTCVEIRQGYKTLSPPIKLIKELIIQGKFLHGNDPVLKWATSNAVPQFDQNENVILTKAKSINRIDPIASTVTGMARAMYQEETLAEHLTNDFSF